MSSTFDYSAFKAQHELHRALRALTHTLREQTDAANVPLFPTVRGRPAPFDQMLKDLKINITPVDEPAFDFQCTGVTLAEVENHCRTTNRDFMTFTQSRGNKLYYNSAYDENAPIWQEMSRPEASDTTQEFSELIFLDLKNTVIDWTTSLANLKRLSTDRRYTFGMMHSALLKIINRFLPEQTLLLKPKTANEIARFLLKLDAKVDKLSHYRNQLFAFQRNPNEDLESVMARITNLVDKFTPPILSLMLFIAKTF